MPKRTPRYQDDDELEEEDERRPRRSRSRDEEPEDDDDEERRPRSRRSRDDEDEEERPRSRRRSRDEEDDEEERPRSRSRRSRDDEDEDDEDEGRERKSMPPLRSGWAGTKVTKAKATDFPSSVKLTEEDQILAFLEDEPFVTYVQHWIDERKGKKSFICLEEDCPLCNIGADTGAKAVFNVALISEGNAPELMQLEAGPMLMDALEQKATSRQGPLTNGYWAMSKSGGGKAGRVNFSIQHVKERDLSDWGRDLEPLDDAAFNKLEKKLFQPKDVHRQTRKELAAVAAELMDD